MDKKKVLKAAINVVVFALPFGLLAIGGYYGMKKYREHKAKEDATKNKE